MLNSTVKVGWIDPYDAQSEFKDYWTGFVIGKLESLAIILTAAHRTTASDLERYALQVAFHDSLYPYASFQPSGPCRVESYFPRSEILILSAPTNLKHGILNFASKEDWRLLYSQKLWALSNPCPLEWVLTKGHANRPRFFNHRFSCFDTDMVLFHHDMKIGSGLSGAAILNKNGRVVGLHTSKLAMKNKSMGLIDAHKHNDISINLGELNLEEEHNDAEHNDMEELNLKPGHVKSTLSCGINHAVHVEYIDKVLRNNLSCLGNNELTLSEVVKRHVHNNHHGSSG